MTNTDVAVIDQAKIDALAAAMGMDPAANSGPKLPTLKTNVDGEDSRQRDVKKNTFYVPGMEPEVFAETIKFRPLLRTYQYSEYNPDENKMESMSVETMGLKDEFIDTKGGQRCGRPPAPVYRELSPEEKKTYENVTNFNHLRGLVSYTGTTHTDEVVTVENQPVIIRLKGINFMAYDKCIGKFGCNIPKGHKSWDFWFDLSLTREKNGSVSYHKWDFAFDPSNPVSMDTDTLDTAAAFLDQVQSINRRVKEKYDAEIVKRGGVTGLADDLGSDFGGNGD